MGRLLARVWLRTGRAPGWYYQAVERWGALFASGSLETKLVNGCRMFCDLRDHVERQIYFLGLYEPIESYIFSRILRPGMTVVDAGANVGQYTLLASAIVGPGGRVHAFEPNPETFVKFRRHLAENNLGNARASCAALWEEETNLRLGLCDHESGNAGVYSIISAGLGKTVECSAIRLDDYVAEHHLGRVHVIKMDIEGSELFALRGMKNTIQHWRPIILMEINRTACARLGYGTDQLWEILVEQFGYRALGIGQSSGTCRHLRSLNGIELCNVILHTEDLPPDIVAGWDLKSVLRWARGG